MFPVIFVIISHRACHGPGAHQLVCYNGAALTAALSTTFGTTHCNKMPLVAVFYLGANECGRACPIHKSPCCPVEPVAWFSSLGNLTHLC